MIKLLKVISFTSLIVICSVTLNSIPAPSSGDKSLSIGIYSFSYDGNTTARSGKHNFYSRAIPETLTKSLNNTDNYKISIISEKLSVDPDILNGSAAAPDKKAISELSSTGKDFIITGTYNIENGKLIIKLVIFNIKGRETAVINHESNETGAILQQTTDYLSERISGSIADFNLKNYKRYYRSPYITLYRPFSIISTGVDGGYLLVRGKWRSIYNDTAYVSPYLNFDITRIFSLSLRISTFNLNSDDKELTEYYQARLLNGSLSLCAKFRVAGDFGIALSAGGGATRTFTDIDPANPFASSLATEDSTDPNATVSAYFFLDFDTVNLKAGASYMRVFYDTEPLDTAVFYAGAGYHF